MQIPLVVAAMVEQEVQYRMQTAETISECPRDNEPAMDGTGAHLGLRNPWFNDLSHEITDSTIFRILLILMVVDWVLKKL